MTANLHTVALLRMAADRNPVWTRRRLRHVTSDAVVAGEPVRVDLLLMLAELELRAGHHTSALQAAEHAGEIATRLVQRLRLVRPWLAALAVSADLAVAAGQDTALAACSAWWTALGGTPQPDPVLVRLADALFAVAVYHHDNCRQGRRLLDDIRQAGSRTGPDAAMRTAGIAAMRAGCDSRRGWRGGPLPPMPGGLLHPHLHQPHVGYLASRVLLAPGRRTCGD